MSKRFQESSEMRRRQAQRRAAGWFAAFLAPAILICGAAFPGSAAQPASVAMSPRAKHGETIFEQRCIVCHNKQPGDTTPFGPPNLNGIFRRQPPLSVKEAVTIIDNGKGTMPGWSNVLTREEIGDVVAYLKTR